MWMCRRRRRRRRGYRERHFQIAVDWIVGLAVRGVVFENYIQSAGVVGLLRYCVTGADE